jgi:hypothetical protein
MRSTTRRRAVVPTLALALILTACGGSDAATDDASRDIQLTPAPADAPVGDQPTTATPAPTTTPAATTPVAAPTPAPAKSVPTAPRRRTGVIAAGTSFAVTNAARICTNTHKAGAKFTTTLAADVTGSNGAKLPAGSSVTIVVTESAISKNAKDQWKLAFDVVDVTVGTTTHVVEGDVTKVATIEAVRSQSTGQQAGKVATVAAIGAVAGQILGKDTKSTVIGGVVGAAGGAAVASGTADYEGCLPANGTITIALSAPLTLAVGG